MPRGDWQPRNQRQNKELSPAETCDDPSVYLPFTLPEASNQSDIMRINNYHDKVYCNSGTLIGGSLQLLSYREKKPDLSWFGNFACSVDLNPLLTGGRKIGGKLLVSNDAMIGNAHPFST